MIWSPHMATANDLGAIIAFDWSWPDVWLIRSMMLRGLYIDFGANSWFCHHTTPKTCVKIEHAYFSNVGNWLDVYSHSNFQAKENKACVKINGQFLLSLQLRLAFRECFQITSKGLNFAQKTHLLNPYFCPSICRQQPIFVGRTPSLYSRIENYSRKSPTPLQILKSEFERIPFFNFIIL